MKSFLSKNAVKRLIQLILGKVSEKEELMEEIGSDEVELLYKYEIAPEGELDNWQWKYYTDEGGSSIVLSKYIGSQENVVVYDKYTYNGKLYDTKLTQFEFGDTAKTTMKTFRVCDNVTEVMTSLSSAFYNCTAVETIDFGNNFNVDGVEYLNIMFGGCTNLHTILGLENWNVSDITSAYSMFSDCSSLTDLSCIGKWNLKNINDISGMFKGCSSLETLDLSEFAISNGSGTGPDNMSGMFSGCSNLKTLILPADHNKFNTENCTTIDNMFYNCSSLTELDLSIFNTSKVTSMSMMFASCATLTELNLTSFNTSKVTNMGAAFKNCSSLTELDLTSFDTSSVTVFFSIFQDCTNLTQILVGSGWNTSALYPPMSSDMFTGCGVQEVTVVS